MPPVVFGIQEYWASPISNFVTSLLVIFCTKSVAFAPRTMNSPMCDTSNSPTLCRTAACSSLIPLYEIGILYPANGAMRAPRAMWISVSGVVFNVNDFIF